LQSVCLNNQPFERKNNMQLMNAFNAQQYDPTQSAGGLPIGRHPVIIEKSEIKANAANNGGYLQLDLLVTDGQNKGATGAMRFNLYHSNPQTVEIAHKQLSAVCHVTRVFMLQDSAQLHNIPFIVDVGPQKDTQYTEVKKVYDMNGCEPGKTAPTAAAAPVPAQAPVVAPVAAPAPGFTPAWGQPAAAPMQAPVAAPAAPAWAPPQAAPTPAAAPAWQQPQAPAQAPAQAPVAGPTPPWAQR
jgi:hypothetical protein